MLTQFIAFGIIAAAPGGGGGSETGPITAASDATAVTPSIQAPSTVSASIPNGAVLLARHFDPADLAPYGLDFSKLLLEGERIASIDELSLNSTAALLGVEISAAPPREPIIDEAAGKIVQIWPVTDEAKWQNAAFNVDGVQLPVKCRIWTDAAPPNRYERTWVLTVRQM